MELNATRFPFPLPPRTIGEQKAKVKRFLLFSFRAINKMAVFCSRKKIVQAAAFFSYFLTLTGIGDTSLTP
jgi:hypothetical protein